MKNKQRRRNPEGKRIWRNLDWNEEEVVGEEKEGEEDVNEGKENDEEGN